tara:strand:+ start:48 stop:539 length:492 start_codon:yes stop_codon:yes gene_type:complete
MKELTLDLVNKLFRYDKETGDLIHKANKGTAKAGDKAGSVNGSGYVVTGIEGNKYRNHRIIFLMHRGFLPDCLDHIDNNKLNNRIENLRPATLSQNQQNRRICKRNTSGVKGVRWNEPYNMWSASVTLNGKRKHVGHFRTVPEAEVAVRKVREQLHGEFVNHG